jgi:hypothetical protein
MVDSSNVFVLEDFESHINKTYIYNFPIEEVYKAFTDKELILRIKDEGNELSFVINGKYIIFLKIIKVIKSKYYYQIKAKTIQHLLNISLLQLILNFFGILLKE